jgi:predicted membrane protein
MKNKNLVKFVMMAMFIAIAVVISPILRIEGMCPTAHLVNIVCAVLLGPVYAVIVAIATAIIRMSLLGIPPLAITGMVFGAFFSGLFYRGAKKIMKHFGISDINDKKVFSYLPIFIACLGEVFGTGIIGSIVSAPVMNVFWGNANVALFFYTPMFVTATLMGGSVAFILLSSLKRSGALYKMQVSLGTEIRLTDQITQ